MKKGDKRGQFYLIAAIIIAGILIAISYASNYSEKRVSYEAKEIAEGLQIESAYVLDYDVNTNSDVFDDFSMRYSDYAGNIEIYYIVVDLSSPTPIREAYMFNGNQKIYFNDLYVGGEVIEFNLDGKAYSFPLEEGKNFYYVVVDYIGGEKYVYTG